MSDTCRYCGDEIHHGFQMGALDHLLATALTASRVESPFFYDALREQADLIAMRYGWTTLEWRPTGDGMWASAVFARAPQP